MSDARYNDGILDFETIDTTHGLWGWFNLLVDVIHQTLTRRSEQSPISQKSKVRQYQGSSAEIMLDKPVLAEVDGDILEKTQHIRFTVDHNSLIVRAPQTGGAVDATGVLSPITGSGRDIAAADANPVSADPVPVSGQPQTAEPENTGTAIRADIPEQPGTGSSLLM